MARKAIERGERWRLRQTVDKANYDLVDANIHLTGHKTITNLLDDCFLRYSIQIQKAMRAKKHGKGHQALSE